MRPSNCSIEYLRLRKVSNFSRSTEIGHCWQHIVLHDWPEQRVWTEQFRIASQPSAATPAEEPCRPALVKLSPFDGRDHPAFSAVQRKQDRTVRRNVDLRRIPVML